MQQDHTKTIISHKNSKTKISPAQVRPWRRQLFYEHFQDLGPAVKLQRSTLAAVCPFQQLPARRGAIILQTYDTGEGEGGCTTKGIIPVTSPFDASIPESTLALQEREGCALFSRLIFSPLDQLNFFRDKLIHQCRSKD
jgi:hypothetical protein